MKNSNPHQAMDVLVVVQCAVHTSALLMTSSLSCRSLSTTGNMPASDNTYTHTHIHTYIHTYIHKQLAQTQKITVMQQFQQSTIIRSDEQWCFADCIWFVVVTATIRNQNVNHVRKAALTNNEQCCFASELLRHNNTSTDSGNKNNNTFRKKIPVTIDN